MGVGVIVGVGVTEGVQVMAEVGLGNAAVAVTITIYGVASGQEVAASAAVGTAVGQLQSPPQAVNNKATIPNQIVACNNRNLALKSSVLHTFPKPAFCSRD